MATYAAQAAEPSAADLSQPTKRASTRTAATPRSAMVIQYPAADNAELGGNKDRFGNGLQVRGVNPYRARMIGGTFKLPGQIADPLQRDG